MMSTQFFTDGTADLTYEYVTQNQIRVINLTFLLDGREYVCTNDPTDPNRVTPEDFYDRMRKGSTPTTAMINQQAFLDAFEPVLQESRDVFYIAFTSALSGSCHNAMLAGRELQEKYPDRRVRVVDSRSASLGEGLLVHLAMLKRDEGMDDEALENYLNEIRFRVHHWFTVDDLVYLKRGGRISGAAATIGSVLNIKPVLSIDDEGHLIPKEKVQGHKRALKALVDHMEANVTMPYTGPVFLSHCDALEDAMLVAKQVHQRFGVQVDQVNMIAPIIGAHTGPGTIALFFLGDKPRS